MNPLDYAQELNLRPLPTWIATLLQEQRAPPRLVAHACLVTDVASQLLEGLHDIAPHAVIDSVAVTAGAALHDIGKVINSSELAAAGHQHEEAGYTLLLQLGVPAQIARFARTHEAWQSFTDSTIEDLVVTLADTCWKGKRDHSLEQAIANQLATRGEPWQVWLELDDLIERLAADAPIRLAWQQQFPLHRNAVHA